MNSNSNTEQVRAAMIKAARDAGQHFAATQIASIPAPLIASALANTGSDSDEQPDAVKKGAERARHRSASSTAKRVDL